ncbi:TPA: type IV conjugative transfer system protein TraL [Photobacterium damselae]
MNQHQPTFYKIPHYLDQQGVIMGFPKDEIIPAAVVFGVFAMLRYTLTGLGFGLLIWYGLRRIKQSKGENFLALSLFWFAPPYISTQVKFKRTPSSDKRYWLN